MGDRSRPELHVAREAPRDRSNVYFDFAAPAGHWVWQSALAEPAESFFGSPAAFLAPLHSAHDDDLLFDDIFIGSALSSLFLSHPTTANIARMALALVDEDAM